MCQKALNLWTILALVLLTACGESASTGTADAGTTSQDTQAIDVALDTVDAEPAPDVPDTIAELPPPADAVAPDATPDAVADAANDASGDGACSEAGCACANNAECNSGLCLDSDDGKRCATPCVSGCPDGYKCTQVTGAGGDISSVCTPATPRICEPCMADSDCNNVLGGADNRCVPYKDPAGSLVGYFCGAPCSATAPCPTGYACQQTQSAGGIQTTQCVKQDLVCPCDARAVKLGLQTTCSQTSQLGTCGGKRACSATGLSSCDAPAASAEQCNNKDDDCDGLTDEPSAGMCDDGNVCTYDNCIVSECQHPTKGGDCDDGSACTSADTCIGLKCVGTAVVCDDKNPCTADSCDPIKGCITSPSDGTACDDGNPCTSDDTCAAGTCKVGKAVSCDDKNLCTTDSCDPASGCIHDNNVLACSDGNICTAIDACQDGACAPGTVVACSDGNPCTDDSCDPQKGCQFVNNSASCNDNNACTVSEACKDGTCVPTAAKVCDDSNPCTLDLCNPQQGCTVSNGAGACDDGNLCTLNDTCKDGACTAGKALGCADGNPCTDDSCDKINGCSNTPNTAPCDDNNSCTLGDACSAGLCVPTMPSPCDDKNPCTTETCDPKQGCQSVANAAPCSDDSVCTLGDACSGGLCLPGSLVNCDDGNPCTNDSCDSVTGCKHASNAAQCSDGNVCTSGDVCAGGVCTPGAQQNCDDGNLCTNDACDAKTGCGYSNNSAPCTDGSVCTMVDTCQGGKCVAGSALPCSDGNVCTDDSCDAVKGCQFANNTAPCNDNNGCTTGDTCKVGTCSGTSGCAADAQCVPGANTPVCACKAGYSGDGFTCSDVNECAVANGGCSANAACANTAGSFTCTCKAGYSGDGKTCADIDECASNPCGANATCTNTPGSFSCGCKQGFADCNSNLAADGCEVDTQNSATNCGGCGKVCPGVQTCSVGQCLTYGNWLVGTPCNGVDYGGGCTPQETGYHYKGSYNGYQCWWHTKNQAWQTSTQTNIYQLALKFGLNPATAGSQWCVALSGTPSPPYGSNYADINQSGAWGWCGGSAFSSGGWVCIK